MLDPEVFKQACKITLAFAGSYLFTIAVQVSYKIIQVKKHSARKAQAIQDGKEFKEKMDRYNDPIMIPADRAVGNFLEWQVPFLTLFWVNAALRGQDLYLGWIYVGLRTVYPLIAINGGITRAGARPKILFATLPGYAILFRYAYLIYQAL
jgi:hypothetical protein